MFRPKCTTLLPCRFWGGVLDANATSFLGSAKPPTTHSQSAHPSVSRLKLRAHNQLNWPTFVSPIFSDMSNAMSNPSVKPAKGAVTKGRPTSPQWIPQTAEEDDKLLKLPEWIRQWPYAGAQAQPKLAERQSRSIAVMVPCLYWPKCL